MRENMKSGIKKAMQQLDFTRTDTLDWLPRSSSLNEGLNTTAAVTGDAWQLFFCLNERLPPKSKSLQQLKLPTSGFLITSIKGWSSPDCFRSMLAKRPWH